MVDAATQYSPEKTGSPVVAKESQPRHQAISVAKALEPPQTPGKRRAESCSPTPVALAHSPPEPNPRINPDPTAIASSSSQNVVHQPVTPSNQPRPATPKRSRADAPAKKPMPVRYEDCDVRDLGTVIADMLMELIHTNDAIPLQDGGLTRFHSRAPPGISVHDYLTRLIVHATLPPPILLSMVFYIDRLYAYYPAFRINSLTVHRFLITAATVGSKGLSDSFWTNSTYARVGGVSVQELAMLELEFLSRVQWKIVPEPEVLVNYYRNLVDRSDRYYIDNGTAADDEGENEDSDISLSDEAS
ncbi:MAG: hypothetical protein M1822_010046 [Bathelium mastoideum]|nr:MAG: hypothetical protein M1822_010046 [Bathelium mastoideum]